jgi:hypothetical protein
MPVLLLPCVLRQTSVIHGQCPPRAICSRLHSMMQDLLHLREETVEPTEMIALEMKYQTC